MNMIKTFTPEYPSLEHQNAAAAVTAYFKGMSEVEAVLLVGSCARGKASPDSCLDLAVLVSPQILALERGRLEQEWDKVYTSQPVYTAVRQAGRFSNVEVEFFDGEFQPGYHGWTSGPDGFELEIGNYLVYSQPLWINGAQLADLKKRWLPFYPEALRRTRLEEAREFCINNLEHIPLYTQRGLYFQSMSRLWNAYREFLQALFIARRVYPIAYDKWIKEQVAEILDLPELYAELVHLFEIKSFESDELTVKAQSLRKLLDDYAPLA